MFITKINEINWDRDLDYTDVENSISEFSRKIDKIYQKCFPIKVKYISPKRLKNRWITQDVKN